MSKYSLIIKLDTGITANIHLLAQDRCDAVHRFTKTKYYRNNCEGKRFLIKQVTKLALAM
jgi:hypothetical protein